MFHLVPSISSGVGSPLLMVNEVLRIDLVRAAEPGELLMLDRYAERISEQTWLLTNDPATRDHCLKAGPNYWLSQRRRRRVFARGCANSVISSRQAEEND